MRTNYVYYDAQNVINAPDKPARMKIQLDSLEQPPDKVRLELQYSLNGKWGRNGHWATAPQDVFIYGLRNTCFQLVQFLQELQRSLGLQPQESFTFDYAVEETTTPSTATDVQPGRKAMTVKRMIVSSPPLNTHSASKVLGEDGWPNAFAEIIWRVRYCQFQAGHNPAVAPLSEAPQTTSEELSALKFALVSLLKAKTRLLRGMRLPETINSHDLARVLEERASKLGELRS